MQNVKASIENYIQKKLVLDEELIVQFEGMPFEADGYNEWIREEIVGKTTEIYFRDAELGYDGVVSGIMLQFNIFVNKEKTSKTNRHYEIRDLIAEHFNLGNKINLYDFQEYDYDNSLQTLAIRDIITDQPIPNDQYHQYNYTVLIHWIEKWEK